MKTENIISGVIAAAIIVLVATVALFAFGGDSDDGFRDPVPGDTFVLEYVGGSPDHWKSYTVIGMYDGYYAIDYISKKGEELIHYTMLVEDPVESFLLFDPSYGKYVGSETIETPFGNIECELYSHPTADGYNLITYIGPDNVVYRQVDEESGMMRYLKSTTMFDDAKDVVDPGIEIPEVTEIGLKDSVSIGDYYTVRVVDPVKEERTYITTVTDVNDGMVTYVCDGEVSTINETAFLRMIGNKSNMNDIVFWHKAIMESPWGNIMVDVYYKVADSDGNGYELYYFETDTGAMIRNNIADVEDVYLEDTNLFIEYVDGVSDTPRTKPVLGDTVTYELVYEDGETAKIVQMVIGYYEGRMIVENTKTYDDGTTELNYYIEEWSLSGLCGYLDSDVEYVGEEEIDTAFGTMTCAVYDCDQGGHNDGVYMDSNGFAYRMICPGGYVADIVSSTMFMPAKDVPVPEIEVPEIISLQVDDSLEVGDYIEYYDYDLGTYDTYTITSINGDVVTYTVGDVVETCTVDEFHAIIKNISDIDGIEYYYGMIWKTAWGNVILNQYMDPSTGYTYWFDSSGLLLYAYEETDVGLMDSTLIHAFDFDVSEPRQQPVIGESVTFIGEIDSSNIRYGIYTVLGTYEDEYIVEYKVIIDGEESANLYLMPSLIDELSPSDDKKKIRVEYIDTIYGVVKCDVYANEDNTDLTYIGPGGVLYKRVHVNNICWTLTECTMFTPAEDVPIPDEKIPEIESLVIDGALEVGDYVTYYNYDLETYDTYTITSIDGDVVTYTIGDAVKTCTVDEFYGLIINIADLNTDDFEQGSRMLWDTSFGYVFIERYMDPSTGYVYWVEIDSGIILYAYTDTDVGLIQSTLIHTLNECVSEPREQHVIGESITYVGETASSDTRSWSYTVIGIYRDEYIIESKTITNGEESTSLEVISSLVDGFGLYDGKKKIGVEYIDTMYGVVRCDVYANEDNTDLSYIGPGGVLYKRVYTDEICWTLTDCTLFMLEEAVPSPGYDPPEIDSLVIDDTLEVGDYFTYYDYNLETYDTYTIASIDGDVVTYTVGDAIETCTVDEFYGLMMNIADLDASNFERGDRLLWNTSFDCVIIEEYYDPSTGYVYWVEIDSGIILYAYMETSVELTGSTFVHTMDEYISEPRQQPVIGDTLVYSGETGSGEVFDATYMVIGTYGDEYIVEFKSVMGYDEPYIINHLEDSLLAGFVPPSDYKKIGVEYIDTAYGVVRCDVYTDEERIDFLYMGPGGVLYKRVYTDNICWTLTETTLFMPNEDVPVPEIEVPKIGKFIYKDSLEVGDTLVFDIDDKPLRTIEVVSIEGDVVTYTYDGMTGTCAVDEFDDDLWELNGSELSELKFQYRMIAKSSWGNVAVTLYTDDNNDEYWIEDASGIVLYCTLNGKGSLLVDSTLVAYVE